MYFTAIALTLILFAVFVLLPLRPAYTVWFVSRPAEFLPAIFFAQAFFGYLLKGTWRSDAFEHWLLVSLMIGFCAHAAYMSFARAPHDGMYDAAHLLKLSSYLAVLAGLMIDVFFSLGFREGDAGPLARVSATD